MGELFCDRCDGSIITVPPIVSDTDVALVCECDHDPVSIILKDTGGWGSEPPSTWGLSRDEAEYICYRCGDSPRVRTSVRGGTPPKTCYHLACSCERGNGGFEPRMRFLDRWKGDMDQTKWDVTTDDLKDALYEEESMTQDEVAEYFDISDAAAKCIFIRSLQEQKTISDRSGEERKVVHPVTGPL